MQTSKSLWAQSMNRIFGESISSPAPTNPSRGTRKSGRNTQCVLQQGRKSRGRTGRALSAERLEARNLFAGVVFDTVFAIGNGTNATSANGGVLIDDSGNRYVSGTFEGAVDFDPAQTHPGDADFLNSVGAGRDLFVAKYDANDHLIWAKRFGSATTVAGKEEVINGFSRDAVGNVYVVGKFQDTLTLDAFSISSAGGDDGFLVKINSNGEPQWASQWGTSIIEDGKNVAVSAAGEVYVVGRQDVDTNSVVGTTEVRKFDPATGSVLWVRSVQSGSFESMIAVDSVGNVNFASSFANTFDADPGPGIVQIIPSGATRALTSTYAIQLNANGNLNWARGFETKTPTDPSHVSLAHSYSLAVDRDDNLVIAGDHAGRVDFDPSVANTVELSTDHKSFVVKLSSEGQFRWVRGVTGSHVPYNKDLQFDSANNMILAGYIRGYNSTLDFDPGPGTANLTPINNDSTFFDSYLWSLTEAGEFRSITHFAKAGLNINILGIALNSSDQIHAVGGFTGTFDFDPSLGVSTLSATARSAFSLRLNNAPGVTVNRRVGHLTSESGQSTSFKVSLDSRPTDNVFVPVSSSDLSEGTVNVSGLTYTPSNWNVPQLVSVAGIDDSDVDGAVGFSIILGSLISNDPAYSGLNPLDVAVVNSDNDVPSTKFYVVDDASSNRTFEYGANGSTVENYSLNSGNATPRGAASTVAGDKVWVVDANRNVYVYNDSGMLLGSWSAGSLASNATIEGITTNGTDIWLVDARQDRVFRYAGAASRLSGSQNATSNFALNNGNVSPKDLVTDGAHIWVVNDSTTDKVFKYSMTGALVGSWTIATVNNAPTGITIDPSSATQSIWIVDNGTDRVYEYANSRSRNSGSQSAAITFALAPGNTNPQGIADPPANSINASTTVAATSVAVIEVPSDQMLSAPEYPQGHVALASRSIAVESISNDNTLTTSKLLNSQPATLVLEKGSVMATIVTPTPRLSTVTPTPRLSTSKSSSVAARDEAFSSVDLLQDEDLLDLLTTSIKGSLNR